MSVDPFSPLMGWLIVSLVYMGYGAWVNIRYPGVSRWFPTMLFVAGVGMFVFVNRHWWFYNVKPPELIEWMAILLVLSALYAARGAVLWANGIVEGGLSPIDD